MLPLKLHATQLDDLASYAYDNNHVLFVLRYIILVSGGGGTPRAAAACSALHTPYLCGVLHIALIFEVVCEQTLRAVLIHMEPGPVSTLQYGQISIGSRHGQARLASSLGMMPCSLVQGYLIRKPLNTGIVRSLAEPRAPEGEPEWSHLEGFKRWKDGRSKKGR